MVHAWNVAIVCSVTIHFYYLTSFTGSNEHLLIYSPCSHFPFSPKSLVLILCCISFDLFQFISYYILFIPDFLTYILPAFLHKPLHRLSNGLCLFPISIEIIWKSVFLTMCWIISWFMICASWNEDKIEINMFKIITDCSAEPPTHGSDTIIKTSWSWLWILVMQNLNFIMQLFRSYWSN